MGSFSLRPRLLRVGAGSRPFQLQSARPLATTVARSLPRAVPRSRVTGGHMFSETLTTAASPMTAPNSAGSPASEPSESAAPSDPPSRPPNPESNPSPSDEPPLPDPSFPAVVTSLTSPLPPTEALSPEHTMLFNHLATSFVPSNQPCVSPPNSSSDRRVVIPDGISLPKSKRDSADTGPVVEEPAIALVCPFEGGDAYVAKAVNEVAAHLSADVVRLDLSLGVGFDGHLAPLAVAGLTAPPIPSSVNPLFQVPPPQPSEQSFEEDYNQEDEGPGMHGMAGMPNMIRLPMVQLGNVTAAPMGGFPGVGFHGSQSPQDNRDDEWISFFSGLINMQLSEGASPGHERRIVLLEATAAMAETFSEWWPSLLEAVRRRRRGTPEPKTKGVRAPPPVTTQPTTIVLSVTPSLLLQHTSEFHETDGDDMESRQDKLRSAVEALGASVNAIHVDGGGRSEDRVWWSSEERDHTGRQRKEERRLRSILNQGPDSLLPFNPQSQSQQNMGMNILEMLMPRARKGKDASSESYVWKTLPLVPAKRDRVVEQHERTIRRRALNAALMMRAVGQCGAELQEPLSMLTEPGSDPVRGRKRRYQRREEPDQEWSELVIGWKDALNLASIAVGRAAVSAKAAGPLVLTWADIEAAREECNTQEKVVEDTVGKYLADAEVAEAKSKDALGKPGKKEPSPITDPVVEALHKAKDLNKHEKRLLSCIVDANKLATASFKDVHLPFKTIDAIRTVISLPLLFPEAFKSGILKDHVTSGALLFGPPGTGKTLLARAIAAESGARMLAIQPSDVNDMWVGEGEKLVKAVFSLARRMSPCVVFIDEVDSLFGARSARDSSGGSKAHNQILTEFMQEMDGLSSASANRDKRVVVVGATNRPFDLDDAVLRRLPRRLLVDLPTLDDRKAILRILLRAETLADDVNIDDLAAKTDGFSGSDLKHLCVAAALASVKDIVHVPWKAALDNTDEVVVPRPSTSTPPGSLGNAVRLEVEPEPEAEEKEGKRPAPLTDSSADHSSAIRLIEAAYVKQLEERAEKEADEMAKKQAVEKSDMGTSEGEAKEPSGVMAEVAGDMSDAEVSPTETVADQSSEPQPLARTLTAKHFATALNEIRPSSSEEGTLPELRKWAEMYGEGGKKQGKKSGFGKGFGFGEKAEEGRKGFGRVSDE